MARARNPLGRLERSGRDYTKTILRTLNRAISRVRLAILADKSKSHAGRLKLYRAIADAYGEAGGAIDRRLQRLCEETAGAAFDEASEAAGVPVELDQERLEQYWEYVHPGNKASLAAVFTENMTQAQISALRRALISAQREASIGGLTGAEMQRLLKERWREYAGDESNFVFIDRSGRRWDNDRYINMLVRTTQQRVYNDALLDRFAEMGCRYVRLASLGVPDCEACKEWQGRLLAIVGGGEGVAAGVPSVEDAREAGVFHPNCLCTFSHVRNRVAEREIEAARAAAS